MQAELAAVTAVLRAARQARRLDRTDACPHEPGGARTDTWTKARDARLTTLTHDTLAGQPDRVVEELRRLNTNGELTSLDPRALANQLMSKAVVLDGGSSALPPIDPAANTRDCALLTALGARDADAMRANGADCRPIRAAFPDVVGFDRVCLQRRCARVRAGTHRM